MLTGNILRFTNSIFEMRQNMDDWKERIKADWQKTFYMPRKMKKQRRKELQLDWSIASFDPLGGIND